MKPDKPFKQHKDPLAPVDALAQKALSLWDLPKKAQATRLNVAENVTYLVEAPNAERWVLRVHREGYHSHRAILSELRWLAALEQDKVVPTPRVFPGRNGALVQQVKTDTISAPRFVVLFEFLRGAAPVQTGRLEPGFETLGAIAARCHAHVLHWPKPEGFERLTWDVEAVLGPAPTWGDWRDAPEVDAPVRQVLEQVETQIRERLSRFGRSPERFNLIHADMRLANLLVSDEGTRLIDFDDCGWGWFLYDFAAAISFMEDDPRIPSLKAAWLRGYRRLRHLSAEEEAEIDTFVMLRRLALLAWIGSHPEAPEPQALAPGFAATSARLGQAWLGQLSAAARISRTG